jgi:2-methylisocitrate lyase-like PEP mutase family enzyme
MSKVTRHIVYFATSECANRTLFLTGTTTLSKQKLANGLPNNYQTMNQYEQFYQLHHGERPLLLANAWNVKSAQLIEKAGFGAIATSSGAIANSLGYEDGEKMPFSELLYIVQRIRACTTIPLTVDMERGYSDDLNTLADNLQQLLDAGISGINLEDVQGEEVYLRKLGHITGYLARTNQRLFINARTDGFAQKLPAPLELTLKRAKLYEDAGADGLFVPAVSDPEIIREITSATSLPVNIVGTPALSSIETLTNSGVRRISMAGFLYGATYREMGRISETVRAEYSLEPLF